MNNEPQVIYARQRWTAEERAAERAEIMRQLVLETSVITSNSIAEMYRWNAMVLVVFALVLLIYRPGSAPDQVPTVLFITFCAVNFRILVLLLVRIACAGWKAREHG